MQALCAAIQSAAYDLYFSASYAEGSLSWEGGMDEGDMSMPVSESLLEAVREARSRRIQVGR